MKKAIVLLSGGLDSCVLAAYAKQKREVIALSFDYGQRHKQELVAASAIAAALDIDHRIIKITLPSTSALLDKSKAILHDRSREEMQTSGIPSTYVHARNTLFLSFAASLAESEGADEMYFGANKYDHACYPDCRPAFFAAFNALLKVATATCSLQVLTPFIALNKKEIIEEGRRLGAPIDLSFSCYDPYNDEPCGSCDACQLRKEGFSLCTI